MMAEFRWIAMSLFLMLVLKFTAAATEKYSLVGGEVTLSCEHVTHDQDNCNSTTWLLSDRKNTMTLFEGGKIHREAEAKSDRLSVTAKCSLVIKKVTHEDAGRYDCRQFSSGQVSDSVVDLSVVSMTEQKHNDQVILYCSVSTYEQCPHTVKWLYEGNKNDLVTSQVTCSASVTFTTSDYNQKLKYYELLKCAVTDGYTKEVHQFTFSPPQSSGNDATTTVTTTTAATISSTTTELGLTTGNKWTSVIMKTTEKTNNTASENNNDQTKQGWWKFIVAAVGLAALIIITVAVIRWKRTKGNKTQMDENMADPEAGVSYASISYTKNTGRGAKVRVDDDDEGDAVTYSAVKAPSSSSAGASADPTILYATINKPKK